MKLRLIETQVIKEECSNEDIIDYKNSTDEEIKKWLNDNNDRREHSDDFNKLWLEVYKYFQKKKKVNESDNSTSGFIDIDEVLYYAEQYLNQNVGHVSLYKRPDGQIMITMLQDDVDKWLNLHNELMQLGESEKLDEGEFFNVYKYWDSYQSISDYKSPYELKKFLDNSRAKNYNRPIAGGMDEKSYELLLNYANEWQKLIDNCGYESHINDSEESEATQPKDIAKKEEYKELVTPTFKVGKKISLEEMDTWVDPRSKVTGWKVKILDVFPDEKGNAVAKVETFGPDGESQGEETIYINRKKVKIGETYDAYIDGIMAMPRVKGVDDFDYNEIKGKGKELYQ